MPKVTCEYCDIEFTTKSNLNRHQKRAKYCLQLQGVEREELLCSLCGKSFSRSDNLLRHKEGCSYQQPQQSETMNAIVEVVKSAMKQQGDVVKSAMKQQGETSEKLVMKILETPTVTNNNHNTGDVYNLIPISGQDLQRVCDSLNIDYVLQGGRGYGQLATDKLFNSSNLNCTDKARKKLRFKGEDGKLVEDFGGKKITQMFFKAIEPKNKELIDGEYNDLQQRVADASNSVIDNTDLAEHLKQSINLQNIRSESSEAAEGKDNKLTSEFVSNIVKLS